MHCITSPRKIVANCREGFGAGHVIVKGCAVTACLFLLNVLQPKNIYLFIISQCHLRIFSIIELSRSLSTSSGVADGSEVIVV